MSLFIVETSFLCINMAFSSLTMWCFSSQSSTMLLPRLDYKSKHKKKTILKISQTDHLRKKTRDDRCDEPEHVTFPLFRLNFMTFWVQVRGSAVRWFRGLLVQFQARLAAFNWIEVLDTCCFGSSNPQLSNQPGSFGFFFFLLTIANSCFENCSLFAVSWVSMRWWLKLFCVY